MTHGDVVALRLFADQFADLDRRHGGGSRHAPTLLADFLHQQVTPMLHGAYTEPPGAATSQVQAPAQAMTIVS